MMMYLLQWMLERVKSRLVGTEYVASNGHKLSISDVRIIVKLFQILCGTFFVIEDLCDGVI